MTPRSQPGQGPQGRVEETSQRRAARLQGTGAGVADFIKLVNQKIDRLGETGLAEVTEFGTGSGKLVLNFTKRINSQPSNVQ